MAEVQLGVFEGVQQGPTAGDRPILILSLFIQVLQAQAGQGAARIVDHGVQAAQHLGAQHAARLKFLLSHPAWRVVQGDINPLVQ